jgi:anti-sigma B factor antagonist
MKVSIRYEEEAVILGLDGKFIAGVDGPFLRQKVQELLDGGTKKLVINLAAVPYIDSTGLGFLVATRTAAEEAGARAALSAVSSPVRKIMDRVQLTQFFLIANDDAAAVQLVKAASADSNPAASGAATAKNPSG